jgi:hypothetical protein
MPAAELMTSAKLIRSRLAAVARTVALIYAEESPA